MCFPDRSLALKRKRKKRKKESSHEKKPRRAFGMNNWPFFADIFICRLHRTRRMDAICLQ